MDQKRQLIVSTHTIALQEQLDQKDLPLCRRVFTADARTRPYSEFKSAVLLGMSVATLYRRRSDYGITRDEVEALRQCQTTAQDVRPLPAP